MNTQDECEIPTENESAVESRVHMMKQKHPKFRTTDETPRQLLTSLVIFSSLLPWSLARRSSTCSQEDDIQIVFISLFTSFVTYSFLQSRDLILTFPHPGFWRLCFGVVAFYTHFMLALLVLSKESARNVIQMVFRDIGTLEDFELGIQERIDAIMKTCAFSYGALMKQIFDCPWFVAHLLGWAGKMMIFRDFYLAFLASVMFEICEVTFMYFIPEFEECWWDSLFLDTLANVMGMFLGLQINKVIAKFSPVNDFGQEIDWVGQTERCTISSRMLMYVSPFTTRYEWKIFSSPKRMLQVLTVAFFMLLVEMNQFLLINALGLPNTSRCVILRLVIAGFLAAPAASEWYMYIEESDKNPNLGIRLGPSIWLLFCMVTVEIAMIIKFFPAHMKLEIEKAGNMGIPYYVLVSYAISFSFILVWFVLKYKVIGYAKIKLNSTEEHNIAKKLVVDTTENNATKQRRSSFWCFNFQQLPATLKRKVLMVELVDSLLFLAFLPMCYLFYIGWKWE